jgi:hypothetical protein
MTINIQKAGTDLDSVLAQRTTGWAQAANVGIEYNGTDLSVRYAVASAGSAAGTTNIQTNSMDIGTLFAGSGTTAVAVTSISAVSASTAAGSPSGTVTSNTGGTSSTGSNTVTATKGKQSGYTYTWTIATGSGVSFPGQGTASTTVSATVNASSTNSGTFYCAVGDGTTTTNTNTVAWSLQNTSSTYTSRVVVDAFSGRYYSVDGVTWGTATGASFGGSYSAASTGTIKMTVGSGTNATISTDGGATWSNETLPGNGGYISGSNGYFQVIAWNSTATTTAYYSTNGTTWNTTTLPVAINVKILGSNGAGYLVGAAYLNSSGGSSNASIISTNNGQTWSSGGALPLSSNWIGVVWLSGTTYVAFDNNFVSPGIHYSITTNGGTTWGAAGQVSGLTTLDGPSIATNGTGTIVIGSGASGSNGIWYSTNGSTWTFVTLPGCSGYEVAVAYQNGFFLAGSYGGSLTTVWKSTDGVTWTTETSVLPAGSNISTIT